MQEILQLQILYNIVSIRSKGFKGFANKISPWVMTRTLVCGYQRFEDIAASSFKVEMTRISMQLLPLAAFTNYISCRLTNLQLSGICAYKIHQATPQRIYEQECPLQKILSKHILCRKRDQWDKYAALPHRVQQ